jgi:phosphate transport system substrate-binding protein
MLRRRFQRLLAAQAALAAAGLPAAGAQTATRVRASGATTVADLLGRWAAGAGLGAFDYAATGSGAGRRDVAEGRVDFAASEQPYSSADLQKLNLRQFPIAFLAIVPVVNLPGVPSGALRLDAAALAAIFAGRLRQWRDPAVARLNPSLALPALDVTPVARADSSGSTFAFTAYLADADAGWKTNHGAASTIKGSAGERADGTGGVLRAVQARPGAIGYAALGAAQRAEVGLVQLATPIGTWISASTDSINGAVRMGEWSRLLLDTDPPFDVSLINMPTQHAWPVTSATYAMLPRRARNGDSARAALRLLQWGLDQGGSVTAASGFVPVDDRIAFKIKLAWRVALTDERGAPLQR